MKCQQLSEEEGVDAGLDLGALGALYLPLRRNEIDDSGKLKTLKLAERHEEEQHVIKNKFVGRTLLIRQGLAGIGEKLIVVEDTSQRNYMREEQLMYPYHHEEEKGEVSWKGD